MAALTPTMDLVQSTVPQLISICISTSAHTLDLSLDTPFTITLNLTLQSTTPITFNKRSSSLFDKTLSRQGLTFTNISTGKLVPRAKIYVSYLSSDGLPREEDKEEWVTLFPDQDYVLETTFKPLDGDTSKWPKVAGFKDGQIYEIGVSEEAGVRTWIEGGLEDILEMRKSNLIPNVRKQAIGFEVRETKIFEVKRPDLDGSLNWPIIPHSDPNKRWIV
ncbi:hypothetical protein BKA66DRAFT_577433 [Pyrenochaeta sp. MPI-SDFR-AT-0127]|nr:hypothetical protein BKA66DRAFT_577433 [Pyrenochaeta sp. MPI-SDFR-AT-0127]